MGPISRRNLLVGGTSLAVGAAVFARRNVTLAGPTDPIGPFFDNLMQRAGFEFVLENSDDLQFQLPSEGQRAQVVVNRVMREGGFDRKLRGVYIKDDLKVYLLGHQNQLDVCAPVFAAGCFGTMFEASTVIALSLAADDWPSPRGFTVHEGLIPRNTLQHDVSFLDRSMDEPYHALTLAGDLSIRYSSKPENRTGAIEVLSREVNGEPIFAAEYEFGW